MAKWLNKYFSLGNNKTKSPPQPPRPDYRDKRNGTAVAGGSGGHHNHQHHNHHHTSPCFPRHDTSDLLRAYRAQKERDFEDPYSGPGSSLRKLRALCRPEYCAPEELLGEPAGPKPFSSASCCGGSGGGSGTAAAAASSASPQLFRSHSERRAATPPDNNGAVKYISPKHRLIKIESNEAGKGGGGGGGAPITWSPPGSAGSGQKKLNKCAEPAEGTGSSGAKKEK
ncbi:UNVERIFIED_CONTAM: hypothetical protein K2H54_027791, partial [Gekko kuhli]